VYVIGMNYNSIDPIIETKFGKNDNIKGYNYMEKIVQLPFHIPTWSGTDVSDLIKKIIKQDLQGTNLEKEFSNNKDFENLLVRAVKHNPRETKMFINTIILANAVFEKDIDKLLVVQALNFRRESKNDWNKFLSFIIADNKIRQDFLKTLIIIQCILYSRIS
jgi:hypothetical protein